jgi:hypothetical protein
MYLVHDYTLGKGSGIQRLQFVTLKGKAWGFEKVVSSKDSCCLERSKEKTSAASTVAVRGRQDARSGSGLP